MSFKSIWVLLASFAVLQEAQAYAQENGLFFMETSAKTALNVNDIFYEIGNFLMRERKKRKRVIVFQAGDWLPLKISCRSSSRPPF